MTPLPTSLPRRARSRALLLSAALAGACGGSSPSTDSVGSPGDVIEDPSGQRILVDPNSGGNASVLELEEIYWGRLVDVYDADGQSVYSDLLVGEDVIDDPAVELANDPVRGGQRLTVLHAAGSAAFDDVVRRAEAALGKIEPKSDAPTALPPFSRVPRNAALALRFSDLLNPATVTPLAVSVRTGDPAEEFLAARILADPNHGALVDGRFLPSRIVIDLAVSELEAAAAGIPTPNGIGLPPSAQELRPSAALRLPTQIDPARGLFAVLANPRGATLIEAGPVDTQSTARELVRAFRAGSDLPEIADPYGGFLRDETPPQLVGRQRITLLTAAFEGERATRVGYRYLTGDCAVAPAPGDSLEIGGSLAIVRASGELLGDQVTGVLVESLSGDPLTLQVGALGTHRTTFRPEEGHQPACFVTVSPEPIGFPLTGIHPGMSLLAEFSEPMAATSLDGLEGLFLTRVATAPGPSEIVVGDVAPSVDRCSFTYSPRVKLDHLQGESEVYYAHIGSEARPATDLAGNAMRADWQSVPLVLNPAALTDRTGGYVLRFDSADEDNDGFDNVRGQAFHAGGALRPRDVRRMSLDVDRGNPLIDQMQTLPHGTIPSPHDAGVRTPLQPRGSRLMTAWRYGDVGLSLNDESTFNIDVEAIHWQVDGGAVSTDLIESFSMELGHSRQLPDEAADIPNAGLFAPDSGLRSSSFEDNYLDEPKLVHPASNGYLISAADSTSSPDGRITVPYPMNQGDDPSRYRYYTWRDTALQAVGGNASLGVPFGGLMNAGLIEGTEVGAVAAAGSVPSIGLPLLMDFKTRAGSFAGSNRLETRLGGFPLTFGFDLPTNFRILSEGGTNVFGDVVSVDPSLAFAPSGGFNEVAAIATIGTTTRPADSLVYMGRLDVVTRVSRAFTVWIPTGVSGVDHASPVLVPSPSAQPAGTQIRLDFRGADQVSSFPLFDAASLDAYGDQPVAGTAATTYGPPGEKNENVLFSGGDATWRASVHQIDGSAFLQGRITFVANAVSGARPTLQALGFAYDLPD